MICPNLGVQMNLLTEQLVLSGRPNVLFNSPFYHHCKANTSYQVVKKPNAGLFFMNTMGQHSLILLSL